MSRPAAGDAATRHHTAMGLLAALLDALPQERRERLHALAAEDPGLAAHVERLLRAHDGAGDFLSITPLAAGGEPAAGARIGPFEVIRALGHGGMGTVWLGVRTTEEFSQQVALKVLRADLDQGADARFRDERRILAALTHPYIAHLVDGGTTADGRPYLAMEYVDGEPITAYADRAGLDLRGRLRLLLKVCAAVQYAHQNLVVHRDIKPSNLLVTADGTPKLLDFGIARLTEADRQVHTQSGAALTPYYASPEQVGGRPITTATDVYSLGVLAYELLAGVGPYRSVTPDSGALAVLEAIRDEDPERPSTSTRRAPGRALDPEVDAILLKALAKDPAARYASADQLAQDIQRYLDGRPVLARGASAGYRVRKFVTRHWAGVAAAGVAVAALGAAAAVSSYQARIARQERALAERRFEDVRKLANAFVFEFDEAVRDTPGTTAARKLVIARSLTYLEDLARDTRDDVTLERELAAAYERIGDVQGNPYRPNLGEREAAMVSYRRSLALRERGAARANATDADRVALADAIASVADLEWAQGRFESALREQRRSVALAMTLLEQAPADPARRLAASVASYREGQSLTKLGRFADAHARYQESIRLLQLSERSSMEERRFGAVSRMKVADCRIREGDVTGAQQDYQAATTTLTELAGEDPRSGNMLRTRAFVIHRQAMAAAVNGDAEGAQRFGLRALDVQQRLASADPNDLQVQGDIAMSLSTLGAIDTWQRRFHSAETRLVGATRLYERIAQGGASFVDQMSERAQAWRRLGDLRAAAGDPRAALDAYATARTLLAQTESDREYAPERVLLHVHAARAAAAVPAGSGAAAGGSDAWLAIARETWTRLQDQGLRVWFGEFGGPTRLADAAAAATRPAGPGRAR